MFANKEDKSNTNQENREDSSSVAHPTPEFPENEIVFIDPMTELLSISNVSFFDNLDYNSFESISLENMAMFNEGDLTSYNYSQGGDKDKKVKAESADQIMFSKQNSYPHPQLSQKSNAWKSMNYNSNLKNTNALDVNYLMNYQYGSMMNNNIYPMMSEGMYGKTATGSMNPHHNSFEPIKVKRQKNVGKACVHCKKAHLACDSSRPCKRCVHLGKSNCVDVEHKRRGRPKSNTKKIKEINMINQNIFPIQSENNSVLNFDNWGSI